MAVSQCTDRVTARETITYSVIDKADVDSAARIYVQAFPHRVRKWFHEEDRALTFYGDLFQWMRLVHGNTFFTARRQTELVGFLVLTLPDAKHLRSACREGFCFRVAWHALSGRYGHSISLLSAALAGLFGGDSAPPNRSRVKAPHVYVVALEEKNTGKGIGSALIEQARAACAGRYSRISLFVERENVKAVRLYERIGFRIVSSDAHQHAMIWDLRENGRGEQQA
jgi:ribosomal protein S18 acetylase RimI-like enzyme